MVHLKFPLFTKSINLARRLLLIKRMTERQMTEKVENFLHHIDEIHQGLGQ